MAQVSGLKKDLLPSLPKAQLTNRSSSGVYQPQLQPQPLSSAASTSCLQEGPPASFTFYDGNGVSEWQNIPGQRFEVTLLR